jgi:dethiobiotin synthetase
MFASKGIFVTGTDTGIGKTFVSCAIIQAMKKTGKTVEGMKPVASGCALNDGQWQNEDALALMQASNTSADYALVNPYALPMATAPQIAAHEAGVILNIDVMVKAYASLQSRAEFILVEGVGGWLAPLSDTLDQSDLVAALQIPVVFVVGMRLGCINHARLTEQAIQAGGFNLLGWIANDCEPEFDAAGDYFQALSAVMQSPCLARMPFNGQLLFAHDDAMPA